MIHILSATYRRTVFALVNLFAIRRSIVSLAFPRRLGNVEFGEEVPARYLDRGVLALSIAVGALAAIVVPKWEHLALIRTGVTIRRERSVLPDGLELLRRVAAARVQCLHVGAHRARQRLGCCCWFVCADSQPSMGARSVSPLCARAPASRRAWRSFPPRDGVELSACRISASDERKRRRTECSRTSTING